MRTALAASLLLALAACGEARAPEADASEPAVLTGYYKAASNTARAITGDMRLERGGVLFNSGVVVFTRTLQPRRGGDVVSRNGDSFAAIAVGPGDLIVELRRVTEQTVPEGQVGLCGDSEIGYIALAHERDGKSVTVLVFGGDEPPGPEAEQTHLCAAFGFAAPDGARTREGVVL